MPTINNPLSMFNPASGIEDLLRMLGGQPTSMEQIRESLLTKAMTEPVETVEPVEPEKMKKWQLIGTALADALSTYAAGRNPQVMPGFSLQRALEDRRRTAAEKTAVIQEQAERQSKATQQRAALEYDESKSEQEYRRRTMDTLKAEEREDVRERERFAREGYAQQLRDERMMAHEREMEQFRAGGKDTKETEQAVKDAGRLIGQWALDPELDPSKMEAMRKQLDVMLAVEGITGASRDYVMYLFEDLIVRPLREQSDVEYSKVSTERLKGMERRKKIGKVIGAFEGTNTRR